MEFTHLIDTGSKNSVQHSYSQYELKTKIIIRNEVTNRYYVFNSHNDFEKWYMTQKEKHYHEIIFGYQNQRIKFDIDINDENINGSEIVKYIIDTVIEVMKELYYCIEDIYLSKKDFIVTDSSGITSKGYKQSYHIILYTVAVANNYEIKNITDAVLKITPDQYKKYIDANVNKSIQNFRLLYSTKVDSNREKIISNKFDTYQGSLLDTMIVPFQGIKILSQLCEIESNYEDVIEDSVVKDIIKAVKPFNILDGHKFRDIKNNMVNFDRIKPTHCTLCDEIHHKDNSLVIMYDLVSSSIYEFCRQSNKSRYICSLNNVEKVRKINFDKIKNQIETKFNYLSNKLIYDEKEMREYELVKTLVVKAQMKVGKTKTLHKYVNTYFNESSIIRFISFRQTFSNNIHSLFDDFELYSNIKGNISINTKRLIIQVESLYRLELDETNTIDLLILDEIESIFNQLGSGLHKNFNASFAMFLWLLGTSKHVICMDANISDRTYNILSKFRKGPIHYHYNKWQTAKDDKFYVTIDKNVWLSQLCSKLKEDKKIVIPTNSITEAKTCEVLIKELYPNKKIKIFSSELKYSEKQLYFNNVHKYWSELDILIYTPTCSAGVSYELEHFDVVFGYFCNSSCDVETCRQMLYRVRNIKTKEYYIYFQELEMAKLPTTSEELHKYLYNKRTNMSQYVKDSNLQYAYDDNGSIKFYETDYYYIWLENMTVTNLSKNNFISRFIEQIQETGAHVKQMNKEEYSLSSEHSDARKIVEEKQNTEISSSPDLLAEDVELIINKISNQQDIENWEYQAYNKYKLRKCFNYTGEITPTFVKFYKNIYIQTIYQNLCDITKYETIQESIDFIIKKESDRYSSIVSNTSKYKNKLEYSDLHNEKKIYTSLSHIIVSNIIKVIGNKPRNRDDLLELIDKEIWQTIIDNEKLIAIDLNITIKYEKIQMINKLLKTMYGLILKKNKDIYTLSRCDSGSKLFTFSNKHVDGTITIITNNKLFLNL